MSLGTLAVGYVGLGGLVALICAFARRPPPGDAFLIVVLWPLYGPFWLFGGTATGATLDPREAELLDALARAAASPLGSMLPDAESARVLARRLREAGTRMGELEAVLARPYFDPIAAERRASELAARGATAAAATTRLRIRTLEQLRGLRLRYRGELDEVSELIAQLVAQAELVRLEPTAASGDLVRELVNRVEGLGELFAYQAAIVEGQGGLEYDPGGVRSR